MLTYTCTWPSGAAAAASILAGGIGGGLLGAVVGWLSQGIARGRWRRAWRVPAEAFVGPEGVYFNGAFHAWRDVAPEPGANQFITGSPAILELSFQSKEGPQTWRIPVPAGQERVARGLLTIACFCSRRNRKEKSRTRKACDSGNSGTS
jgi:hypothetical protein